MEEKTNDNLDRLGYLLYGNNFKPRHYIGGPNAKIFEDAANEITNLRARLEKCEDALTHKVMANNQNSINQESKEK